MPLVSQDRSTEAQQQRDLSESMNRAQTAGGGNMVAFWLRSPQEIFK